MVKSIGVFDSGVGGLTVVRELVRVLPNEQIVYFGDTARVPYGGKSTLTIRKFADQIVQFLLSKDVKLIVVACNTVSATSLEWLKARYSLPIIGVIEPGVRQAIRTTKNQVIGVIGTKATIESGAYKTAIHKITPKIKRSHLKVYSKSCPLLVPLVEEGWINYTATTLILGRYLSGLKKKKIDTLILGCTHYPLLKHRIKEIMGTSVKLIDSAASVALEVRNVLKKHGIEQKCRDRVTLPLQHKFYFSDVPRGFRKLSDRFLGFPVPCNQITLG
ncbi:MAG: glutamate racemase [bacterium]|nr:glutamate racemase [bacterium]